MKLNIDCIRDILFAVEENTGYRKELIITNDKNCLPIQLQKYEMSEVLYHIKQCEMAGLIIFGQKMLRTVYSIADLTPTGHEFLADIRQDNNWSKIKEKLAQIGSFSLDVVSQVSKSVIAEAIKKALFP